MDCLINSPSKPGSRSVIQLMVVIGLLTSGAQAAENTTGNEAEQHHVEMPDLELLEFLASFETDAGEWIDPIVFLDKEFEQLLSEAESQNNKQTDTSIESIVEQTDQNDD